MSTDKMTWFVIAVIVFLSLIALRVEAHAETEDQNQPYSATLSSVGSVYTFLEHLAVVAERRAGSYSYDN